jgi:TPR repeat protein
MLDELAVAGRKTRLARQGKCKMSDAWIEQGKLSEARSAECSSEDLLVANCLAAAAHGDISAYYDLGIAFSTGSHGVGCDLIEAHKWFNLAAVDGHEEAQMCRADISEEMTAREIAEAQRRAREWLAASTRKAA